MHKEILSEDVHYYTDVFDDPEKLIQEIEFVDQFQDSASQIGPWVQWISSDKGQQFGFEKLINHSGFLNNTNRDLHNSKIASMIRYRSIQIAEEYALSNGIELGYLPTHCKIYKYNNFQEMGPHIDYDPENGGQEEGTVSIVFYLNDDYEGGELAFPNDNLLIKPKAGSGIVFKSKGTLHHPKPTTKGTKYMVAIFLFKR